ncbi:MAG: hypothetical protein WD066_04640 [Planctomycetaceae bacterium]
MSRRVADRQEGFGSDSFLDIIANIVGVLIILIVLSGLRVSKAPIAEDAPEEASRALAATEMPQPSPAAPIEAEPSPEPPAPIEPSPELLARIEAAEAERARLAAAQAAVEAERRAADEARAADERRVAEARGLFDEAVDRLQQAGQGLRQLNDELQRSRAAAERLHVQLARAEEAKSPVKELRHRVTPIARTVKSKEVHFRLANDQVAPIPLDDLIERVKSQIERQKDWLAKFNRHEGEVGPVEGFALTYVLQRQEISTFDRLRTGQNLVRVAVTHWELQPRPGLRSESAMEAFRSGSAFRRTLQSAEPDATLTFWVYPDSFELFRQLQEVAHAEGFTVAARPLPFGVEIAGSPQGSHSAAQ